MRWVSPARAQSSLAFGIFPAYAESPHSALRGFGRSLAIGLWVNAPQAEGGQTKSGRRPA